MIVSKVTAKSQTTLPNGVRKALGLSPGDSVAYVIEGDRAVIRKAPARSEDTDPALAGFLALLERDIAANPRRLRAIPAGLVARLRALTADTRVDLDEQIEGAVAL